MPRRRKGSAYTKRGVIVVAVSTWRAGEPKPRWVRACAEVAPPPKGIALTLDWAHAAAEALQKRYDHGWSPWTAPPASPAPAAPAALSALEVARKWKAALPKAQALDDGRRAVHYLERDALGARPAGELTDDDAHAFVARLLARPSHRGGTLSPRSVRNIYDATRRALAWAASRGVRLLPAAPWTSPPDNLPAIADKSAEFRPAAVFTRDEARALCFDGRVPGDRQMLYRLLLLTGCRFGEVAALRWRHWTRDLAPLGRLVVALSVERATRAEKTTKTGVTREVPVHPTLAAALAAWHASGWRELMGRDDAPGPDDYVIPSREGRARSVRHAHRKLQEDLARLGLRGRRLHDTRRTFVSLCLDDGARGELLKHVTHGRSKRDMMDVYGSAVWATYCAEVARLRFDGADAQPTPPAAEGSATAAATAPAEASGGETKNAVASSAHGASHGRGGRDLNPARSREPTRSGANPREGEPAEQPHDAPDGRSATGSATAVAAGEDGIRDDPLVRLLGTASALWAAADRALLAEADPQDELPE